MNEAFKNPKEVLQKVCHTSERLVDSIIYTIEDIRYPELNGKQIERFLQYGGYVYEWVKCNEGKRLVYLDSFIEKNIDTLIPHAEWVYHPGFNALYVRYGPMYIKGEKHLNVFTYANATASEVGGNATKKLLKHIIINQSQTTHVIFENVLNPHLRQMIESLNFKSLYGEHISPPSYYITLDYLKKVIK